MTVRDFINHLGDRHELMFFDDDEKLICTCDSDSVIVGFLDDWSIESFRTGYYNSRNDSAGLKIIIMKPDLPF